MYLLFSGLCGLLFGAGLALAGMANPAKVIGFLDLAGAWDPSLALVMAGAVAVSAGGFLVAKRRVLSLLGAPLRLPLKREIDRGLIAGSLLFGVGWGLAGICPGPALVLLGAGNIDGWIFVTAMLGGMALYELSSLKRP